MSHCARAKPFPKAPVALTFFAVWCLIWLVMPPCFNRESFLASLIDKHKMLERARSPKVVFVGGSNLAYGLDSAMVSKAMDEDVVNMGVSRLLGLRYCLEEVKEHIYPGDTVVICPEYENFYGEMGGSSHLMNVPLLLPRSTRWIWRSYGSSPARLAQLFEDLGGVLNFKWNWWRKQAIAYLAAPHPFEPSVMYNPAENPSMGRHQFTAYGDFVGHLKVTPPKQKYFQLLPGCRRATIDPEAVKVMNEFSEFCTRREAKVALLPPPLPESLYLSQRDKVDQIFSYCTRHLNFAVLSSPQRYAFADHNFFNSLYHLCGPAREKRTAMVIEDLAAQSQTASSLPSDAGRL